MVVNFFEQPGHVLIQFSLGKSETAQILGFGGQMIDNKRIAVERAYFQPMKPINVDDGICIFSFKGHHLDNVFCGAKVDANGYRTVAVVKFTASPGQ